MLGVLRIVFGFALFAIFAKMTRLAGENPDTSGISDGGYLALAVLIGIANAVVWAPLVGKLLSDPLTGAFTTGHPADARNGVVQFIAKLALRRWRRTAVFFAFLEGVRHPDMPAAFVLGLNNARPGSWLEFVFAREVWRFQNAENCLRAWKTLRRWGKDPGLHPSPEVNLLLMAVERDIPPTPAPLPVPPAPPPAKPKRRAAIQLFSPAGQSPASAMADDGSVTSRAASASPDDPAAESDIRPGTS